MTDGIIATNTTVSRENLKTHVGELGKIGAGGLSGAPLRDRSNEVIAYLRQQLGHGYPIIGVGGVMSPKDAVEKLKAGADLIQIYTGFVYEGPGFIKRIKKAMLNT
jgi:dihydroorotate dehydrogenase